MGRSASSCGCPKRLQRVPWGHFPGAWRARPYLPSLGSLHSHWGHFQRERPVAQLTHVLVLNEAGVVVRPRPDGTAFLVMGMLPVVDMVRAARNHVPDLVHEFQTHHQRPCGQQRERRKAGLGRDVHEAKHDRPKLAWVGGIWPERTRNCGTLRHGRHHDAKPKLKQNKITVNQSHRHS